MIDGTTQQLIAKIKILGKLLMQTNTTLGGGNERKIHRLKDQIQNKVDECYSLITEISEMKLLNEDDEDAVSIWTTEQENKMELYEVELQKFDNFFRDLKKQIENEEIFKSEAAAENQRRQTLLLDEERFERKKQLESQLEADKLKRAQVEKSKAKLPKLEITGLPFTEEGYKQAKEILQKKYGVTSEIVHAHGKNILRLPTLQKDSNLRMIHEFYRSLNVSVNSLKTLGKLETAEILVRETLAKLGPIKSELTRNDPDWQSWNLEKLLESLREYIVRNPDNSTDFNRDKSFRERSCKEKHFRSQNRYTRKIFIVLQSIILAVIVTKLKLLKKGEHSLRRRICVIIALDETILYVNAKAVAVQDVTKGTILRSVI